MRYVELRRHTGNEGDRLTLEGAAAAKMIGRDELHPPYAAFVSTGAARATQMLQILRHTAGQDDIPITAAAGLRSLVEYRWRQAAAAAGKGADLEAMRAIDADLVERESWLLGSALRQVVESLPEGGRALVVGHSPTTRGRGAWARRAGCPAAEQGRGDFADRGRRGLPGGATDLIAVSHGDLPGLAAAARYLQFFDPDSGLSFEHRRTRRPRQGSRPRWRSLAALCVEQRCSGAALGALPLIVVFLPFQRQIAGGSAAVGIK